MRAYLLGDSHTQALGPRLASLVPGLTYEAFSGNNTRSARAKASIPRGQDVVMLSLGGNDRGDQSVARAALVADVKRRNPGARIVWFGPFDASQHATVGPRHDEQAASQRRQLSGLGVTWVDTRPWSRSGHRGDNVHFTMAAYSRMAKIMRSAIAAAPYDGKGGLLLPALAVIGAITLGWRLLRR